MNNLRGPDSSEQLAGLLSLRLRTATEGDPNSSWAVEPGQAGCVDVDRSTGRVSLSVADGASSISPAAEEGGADAALLQSVAQLVRRWGCRASFTVESADRAEMQLELRLFLPASLWLQGFPPSSAAAAVFRAMRVPWQETTKQAGVPAALRQRHEGADDRFSLDAVFQELPAAVLAPAPAMHHGTDRSRLGACLGDVPEEAMRLILANIRRLKDVAALRLTCRALNHLASDVVPGLCLRLFPHQRAAVQWMRAREAAPAELPHPFIRHFKTEAGFSWFGCLASGAASAAEPPQHRDIRGGLFCDEPGLGKTITALSLILSTLGRLPEVPAGAVFRPPAGPGRLPSYLIPELSNGSEQSPALRNRRSSRRLSMRRSLGSPGPSIPEGCLTEPSPPRETMSSAGLPDAAVAMQPEAPPKLEADFMIPEQLPPVDAQALSTEGTTPASNGAQVQDDLPPGWVLVGAATGLQENVAHFASLLESHQDLVRDRDSALWWLSRLTVSGLAVQLKQPSLMRVPHPDKTTLSLVPYGAAFRALGFVAVENAAVGLAPATAAAAASNGGTSQEGGNSSAAADKRKQSRKRRRTSAKGAAGKPQRADPAWACPHGWSAVPLALDTPALAAALRTAPVLNRVFLSSATLVVVPSMLIRHWEEQIESHVELGRLQVGIYNSQQSDPEELAGSCDIVLTTFNKLSNEFQTKSGRRLSGKGPAAPGLLHQVHWQRIILDEGHMLGQSLSMTSKLAMAMILRAGSRWVMTGTPTPSTPTKVHISHLQPLLAFLHEEQYGLSKQAWDTGIQKPMLQRDEFGREQLVRLLQRIMMRASKDDLLALPPCTRQVTTLNFAAEHAVSYNQLTETIRRNFLLADWNDEDHTENLLNPVNRKWAQEMLNNVRQSCCVAGNLDLIVKEEDLQETLMLLAERLGLPPPKPVISNFELPWVEPDHPLAAIENGCRHGAACQMCGNALRMPIVTPCAHMLCVDCLQPSPSRCPLKGCGQAFRMQMVDDPTRIKNNPYPKWEVPHELIEWQPSYAQHGAEGLSGGEWQANWQVTKSTKCVYMLQRLAELGIIPPLDNPVAGTGGQQLRPSVNGGDWGGHPFGRADAGPESKKAIIFSQFWMHILLAARHLASRGVEFCLLKRGLSAIEKDEAVNKFQKNPETRVLLMDESGAVGLDLSFVSYVLLLEPIADLSMEEQVISRAHRMGAKELVRVETLMMAGTAEEELLWLQNSAHQDNTQPPRSAANVALARGGRPGWQASGSGALNKGSIVAGTVMLHEKGTSGRRKAPALSMVPARSAAERAPQPGGAEGGCLPPALSENMHENRGSSHFGNGLEQQSGAAGADIRALGNTLLKHLHAVSVHNLPTINGAV